MPAAEAAKAPPTEIEPVPGSSYWLNLTAAGLVALYLIYAAWQAASHMICSQIAVDYCDSLSAAAVANARGYAAAYDHALLQRALNTILPAATAGAVPALPYRYLPIFLLPFQPLARLDPVVGFWIWTALNAVALPLYLRSFIRRAGLPSAPARPILLLCISLPVFMNLLLGQMNLLLVICVGEFMVAMFRKRCLLAGLWLGGLLLKPQLLVFAGLVLLLQRAWKILAGTAACSAALGLVSMRLMGPAGVVSMLNTWLSAAGDQDNTWVQGMMNWRMVGTHFSNWLSPWAGWGLAGAGMLATLAIMVIAWRRRISLDGVSFAFAVLGVLTGSLALAWHSHIHMAVVAIPPLLYLYQARLLPGKLYHAWVFIPALVFVALLFLPEALIALGLLSANATPVIYFILGLAQLSANLFLFGWAAQSYLRWLSPSPAA